MSYVSDLHSQRTRSAFMWTRILRTPFWAIYLMLPVILYKDLHGTPFQVAVLIALKPIVSLFSLYWSDGVHGRPDRLRSNVIWAGIISMVPFFLFPWVDNPWYFVFASGFFMLFHRGVIPAWMEIFKLNLPKVARESTFAYGSALGYIGDGVLPFVLGWFLDVYFQAWRWVFPLTACVSLFAVYFQARIPIHVVSISVNSPPPWRVRLIQPWTKAWQIIKERPDFRRFQVGFMLGGAGLVVLQPALPMFFVDVLNISYMELAIALTLCKGVGFALTSQAWALWMGKVNIYRFSSLVTALAALFPLCLLAAQWQIGWLYLAYLLYGIMQVGSELSWNLSGPLFAQEADSSVYSNVNILTVGLRGCIAPVLGSLLYAQSGSVPVLFLGAILCLIATVRMYSYSQAVYEPSIR